MDATSSSLATLDNDVLRATDEAHRSVGWLARSLAKLFPPEDAEPWDFTGLLCGDPEEPLRKVAVALDVTLQAIRNASETGCNVLLTHHPAFLKPPETIMPDGEGSLVWEAVSQRVALINFHTALDVSPQAARVLPGMLSLDYSSIIEPLQDSSKGYGQLCHTRGSDDGMTLSSLAARCTSVFGRVPRVWGDPGKEIESIVTCTGSAADLPTRCIERSLDCLVCGEIRYHAALDASNRGLSIVELGHDTSELPLCALLASSLQKIGIPEGDIILLDQGRNWWTPEATRR